MIELPVSTWASSVQVELGLWKLDKKGYTRCDMIFDTGAYMTSIDTAIAKRLGLDLSSGIRCTVTGVGRSNIPVNRMVIPKCRLGMDFDLGPVLVDVLDFPNDMPVQAVLGLNVIKEFICTIDFTDTRLIDNEKCDGMILMKPAFDTSTIPTVEDFDIYESRFGLWTITQGTYA